MSDLPYDHYKDEADRRLAEKEAWRLRQLHSPKGRLGLLAVLLLLAALGWLVLHRLNRHQDWLIPEKDGNAAWYKDAPP